MHVDAIETPAAFDELRARWDAVYAEDPEAHYFLSWPWLKRAFQSHEGHWRVLAARPAPGAEPVAFLPVRVTTYLSKRHQVFCNELRMPGLALWSDYTGLLCLPDHEEAAIPALARALTGLFWAQLELKNLRMSERRLELLLAPLRASDELLVEERPRGRNSDGIDNDICPRVELPSDFAVYQAEKMSANKRQKLRRFLRMVEREPALRVTEATPETYERDVGILVGLWREMWAEKKGDDIDKLAAKFKDVLLGAARAGDLYLPVMWSGDRPVGALGTYVDRQKKVMYVKATGRDASWKLPPTGLVLHGHSIRWGIEQGMRIYDFMRGDEEYKYFYGAENQRIRNWHVRTRSRLNLGGTLDPLSLRQVLREGAAYEKDAEWKKAETAYRQALEIAPTYTEAQAGLERVLRHAEPKTRRSGRR